MSDIYIHKAINKLSDVPYIFSIFLLIGLIFVFNFIQSTSVKSYGDIYVPIFVIALILGIIAVTSNSNIPNLVIYGKIRNEKSLYTHIAIGVAYGAILISSLYTTFTLFSFLSIPVPLSFTSSILQQLNLTNPTILSVLPFIFIIGFVTVEAEEMLFSSILVPTFSSAIGYGSFLIPLFLIAAGLFLFVYQILILAIIFTLAFLAVYFFPSLRRSLVTNFSARVIVSILIVAFVFSLYHIYAYGNNPNFTSILISASSYFVIANVINWRLQSAIASRVAHSINNSFQIASIYSLPLISAFLVPIFYIIMIISVFKIKGKISMV